MYRLEKLPSKSTDAGQITEKCRFRDVNIANLSGLGQNGD